MKVPFCKYNALENDFLVVELRRTRIDPAKRGRVAATICQRRRGVGADGVLYVSAAVNGDRKIELYNSDGSWAEKSGNGLRIVAVHEHLKNRRKKRFLLEMGGSVGMAEVTVEADRSYSVRTDLGKPRFETHLVPVKSRRKYMIAAPLSVGGHAFPVTCLSIGNPHTVLFVADFDFDWRQLGADIEVHRAFPRRTNVEFVRVRNRRRLELADWERGAGATGSSGTGAAAAVCAAVVNGLADRWCEVVFPVGSLFVEWSDTTDSISLRGPVSSVAQGEFSLGAR